MNVTSREQAREYGSKRFFTGAPCSRGHISERFVSTGQCCECQLEHRRNWRLLNPEKERESRVLGLRRWAAKDPERKRALNRKSNAKPSVSANNVRRAKEWQEANPEAARKARLVSGRNRRARKKGSVGTHTADDIVTILERQKYRCAECSASVKKAKDRHVDHIMPIALGGVNDRTNLQILCVKCNLRKAAKHPIDFARERGRLV